MSGAALKIAFVSDVTCPWCAIALAGLERAIARLRPQVMVGLQLEPFELNPGIPPEGEDIGDYAARKYGATPGHLAERQALIMARGAEAGLHFIRRTRIWNTFEAHRLLQWAATQNREIPLKRALLGAYHEGGENPGSRAVLLRLAGSVGLDLDETRSVLDSDAFGQEVRARVRYWQARGLHSVPSVVIDDRHLLQGALLAEDYERALRRFAVTASRAAAATPA